MHFSPECGHDQNYTESLLRLNCILHNFDWMSIFKLFTEWHRAFFSLINLHIMAN